MFWQTQPRGMNFKARAAGLAISPAKLVAPAPILNAWAAKQPEVFPNYFAGKWGPECADRLLERGGHAWRNDLGRKG